jgi:hypothetical protein
MPVEGEKKKIQIIIHSEQMSVRNAIWFEEERQEKI